jgi:hypothetical protein
MKPCNTVHSLAPNNLHRPAHALHGGCSELRLAYIKDGKHRIEAIRAEIALATPERSMVAMKRRDEAHLEEQEAQAQAAAAREAYQHALARSSATNSRTTY